MNNHLNHQQICDLLIDPTNPDAAASAHLAACPACSAEFDSLTAGLHNFQQASIKLAELEIARRPAAATLLTPSRSRGLIAVPAFAAVAALLLAVAFLPQHRIAQPSAPRAMVAPASTSSDASDEAILNEIDQDLDASIPTAMQPLAGPADLASSQSPAQPGESQ